VNADFSEYDNRRVVILDNGDCRVEIRVRPDSRLGSLRLQFVKNEVVASVPRMLLNNVFYIREFIEKHRRWIFTHYKRNLEVSRLPLPIPSPCILGTNIILNGQPYPFIPTETDDPESVFVFPDGFRFKLKPDLPDYYDILEEFVTKYAFEKLGKLIREISDDIGFSFNRLTVRPMRSKWGSCRGNRNITLNSRLIHAPETVQRYVCIHELCHLREMNHSARFWSLVGQFYPDYKKARKWVMEHSFYLD